jgi:hypothetical protein
MKKNIISSLLCVMLLGTLGTHYAVNARKANTRIIGYLVDSSVGELNALNEVKLGQLTDLIWGDIMVTNKDDPTLKVNYGYPFSQLTDCVNKGHSKSIKVMASIFGDSNMTILCKDPVLRNKLLFNLKQIVIDYELDGIEVDWEGGPTVEAYDSFLIDLSNLLTPLGKITSAAVYPMVSPNDNQVSPAVVPYIAWLDVMNYNFLDGNQNVSHSLTSAYHSLYDDCVNSMNLWLATGIPANKFVFGIPFYGKSDTGNITPSGWGYIYARYGDIVDTFNPAPNQNQANVSSWQGLNVPDSVIWWNGINLVEQKVDYVLSNGLAGVMCYEIGGDKFNDARSLLQVIFNRVNGIANQPPIVNPVGDQFVHINQLLSFTISATDPNSDNLTYSASNLPSGATFNVSTHTFFWKPNFGQAGTYPNIHFEVTDGSLTASDNITIIVSKLPPILNFIGNHTVNEGTLLSFTVSAIETDSDTLAYSASNLPPGASFNASTHTFFWTPTLAQTGTYANVHFQVADGSLVTSENIIITVSKVNQPPILTSIGDKTVTVWRLLKFRLSANDSDGKPLIFSASNLPIGSHFDPSTQTYFWIPKFWQIGKYQNVHFEVSDGNLTTYENITISVHAINFWFFHFHITIW